MIERDRVDSVEEGQVVLVRGKVSVPGNDIEGGMILMGLKETAAVLVNDPEGLLFLMNKGRNRGLEITNVRQSVCTDGTQIGQ